MPKSFSIKDFLLLCSPLAVIFIIIPFEIYFPQRDQWANNLFLPVGYLMCCLALMFIIFPEYFVFHRKYPRKVTIVSIASGVFAAYLLLSDIIIPLNASQLDGWSPKIVESKSGNIKEIFIISCLIFFSVLVPRKKLYTFSHNFAFVIWSVAGVCIFTMGISSFKTETLKEYSYKKDLPNIYHIVLDELQTDAALEAISDIGMKKNFKGFTAFPFNRSNFLFTNSSFPNYMSGSVFHQDMPFNKWGKIFREKGILKELSDSGYVLSMYVPTYEWSNKFTSKYKTIDNIMNESVDSFMPGLSDFMAIWLSRIAPNFLAEESFSLGPLIELKIEKLFGHKGRYPRLLSEGRAPFASVLMLKNATKEEESLPAYGRYTYLHAILPHGPYVMNSQCRFSRRLKQQSAFSYYNQTICGLKLVSRFIQKLKKLNRFNQSIIIVHADTGHGLRGLINIKGNEINSTDNIKAHKPNPALLRYPDWNPDQLLARTLSFLMIKPQGGKSPLAFSVQFSTLSDLFPTLMGLLAKPLPEKTDGAALFSGNYIEQKENAEFFFFDPRLSSPDIKKIKWEKGLAESHIKVILGKFKKR